MKKILNIILILILSIFLTGCKNNKNLDNKIIVSTNGGVPFVWEYEIEDKTIVKVDKTESKELSPGVAGGKVEKYYYFKGIKKGKTTVTFKYNDIRDNSTSETKIYEIIVDDNLNTKIKEK